MSLSDLTAAQLERRREIARLGGLARARQFTREYQQAARSRLSRAQLVMAGKLGYQKCAELYGHDFAGARLAEYRRKKLSPAEQQVAAWLDEMGLGWEREAPLEGQYADFLVLNQLVIECDSNLHSLPGRAEYDARKEATIKARGLRLLRLKEKEILRGNARTDLVAAVSQLDQAPLVAPIEF